MHRKHLVGIAPLLAVICLAAAPAAAQAEPHWYLNSVLLKPGKKYNFKTEGKLTFSIPGTTIVVGCTVKDADSLLNPIGGGAGTDLMTAFKLSECGPNPCPVNSAGVPAAFKATTLKLPWASKLVEVPPIADEMSGIEVVFSCKGFGVFAKGSGTLSPWVNPGGYLEFTAGTGTLGGMSVTGIDVFRPAVVSAKNP